jgi:biotin transport system substrate-specific component
MSQALPLGPSTRARVLAEAVPGGLIRDAALVLGGAGLVGAAAQVSVPLPFTPVPLTGQTFAVLVVGAALGWRRGLASMLVYLLAGVAGAPWFAGGSSGAGGASFGYVVGFLLAAAAMGRLAALGGDRKPLRMFGLMLLGSALIYAVGVPWLAVALHLGAGTAIDLGLVPFLIGDIVKALAAALLLPTAWKLVEATGKDQR